MAMDWNYKKDLEGKASVGIGKEKYEGTEAGRWESRKGSDMEGEGLPLERGTD